MSNFCATEYHCCPICDLFFSSMFFFSTIYILSESEEEGSLPLVAILVMTIMILFDSFMHNYICDSTFYPVYKLFVVTIFILRHFTFLRSSVLYRHLLHQAVQWHRLYRDARQRLPGDPHMRCSIAYKVYSYWIDQRQTNASCLKCTIGEN